MSVLEAIAEERGRQDARFGEQNHGDPVWASLLAEELGEVHKAINDHLFKGSPEQDITDELVQVAAVAVAWLEAIERCRSRRLRTKPDPFETTVFGYPATTVLALIYEAEKAGRLR